MRPFVLYFIPSFKILTVIYKQKGSVKFVNQRERKSEIRVTTTIKQDPNM